MIHVKKEIYKIKMVNLIGEDKTYVAGIVGAIGGLIIYVLFYVMILQAQWRR